MLNTMQEQEKVKHKWQFIQINHFLPFQTKNQSQSDQMIIDPLAPPRQYTIMIKGVSKSEPLVYALLPLRPIAQYLNSPKCNIFTREVEYIFSFRSTLGIFSCNVQDFPLLVRFVTQCNFQLTYKFVPAVFLIIKYQPDLPSFPPQILYNIVWVILN